jgi:hypothetical protein
MSRAEVLPRCSKRVDRDQQDWSHAIISAVSSRQIVAQSLSEQLHHPAQLDHLRDAETGMPQEYTRQTDGFRMKAFAGLCQVNPNLPRISGRAAALDKARDLNPLDGNRDRARLQPRPLADGIDCQPIHFP